MSFIQYYEEYLIELSDIMDNYWDSTKNIHFPSGIRPNINIALTNNQVYIVTSDNDSTIELLDIYKNKYVIIAKNNHIIQISGIEFYYLEEDNLKVISCSQLLRNEQKIHNYLFSNKAKVIMTSIGNLV